MKKVIIAILFIVSMLFASFLDFANGYRAGYKLGYCYQEVDCRSPSPVVPYTGEDDFASGYQRGFYDGLRDAGK